MRETAYGLVTSAESLDDAWQLMVTKARPQSRMTSGVDGQTIDEIQRNPGRHIERLSSDLRSRSFKFSQLKPHFVPKPNSTKERLICVPTVRDRIVQRSALTFLTKKYRSLLANDISYGFVEGRSVAEAAARACNLRKSRQWVYKTDIAAFFDTVGRDRLAETLKQRIKERSLWPLLLGAGACEVAADRPGVKAKLAKTGIREGLGVRQGMPLSPFFANLFLSGFDREVIKRKFAAVRYADDLIFLADSENQCLEIDEFCRVELSRIGLAIPLLSAATKTIIWRPEQEAEFLGLGLRANAGQYELILMKSQYDKIREQLLLLGSIEYLNSRGITLATLGAHIQARISGYMSAYQHCTNLAELERALSDLHAKVLRLVYGPSGLKIELNNLGSAERAFLGIT